MCRNKYIIVLTITLTLMGILFGSPKNPALSNFQNHQFSRGKTPYPHNSFHLLNQIHPAIKPTLSDTLLVKTITQISDSLGWKNKLKTGYFYNSENQCQSMVEYTFGNHWIEIARDLYSYDAAGYLVETIKQKNDVSTSWRNYRKYQFYYNVDAKIDSIILQRWYDDKWQGYYAYSYFYDTDGFLVESNQYRYNRHAYKTTFSYDSLGNILSFLTISPMAYLGQNRYKGNYTYHSDQNLIEYKESYNYGNYNEDWRLIFSKISYQNELNLLLSEVIDYSHDSLVDSTITYVYNSHKKMDFVNCETSQYDQILERAQTTYYYDDYSTDELKYVNQQADYLVVIANQFAEYISYFVFWKQEQGLNVKVVLLDQVYDEFDDTPSNHQSIREFISYTQDYWAEPKPKYVLLVGDTDMIPTFSFPSHVEGEGSVPIDEWFVINQFEDDDFPDVAIGRWPVSNKAELKNIIQKTIAFESGECISQSLQNVLFLNDEDTNPSTKTVFEDLSAEFISTVIPPKFHINRIDIRPDSPFHDSKQNFISQINSGIGHMFYYGHGTPTSWSRDMYLNCDDVSLLEKNNKPFILSTMGCSQDFSLPDEKSLLEELLFLPNGGAVATVASPGYSSYITGSNFFNKVYSTLFQQKEKSIGKIMLQVKNETYNENTKPDDMTRRYTLLGDPALKIPFDLITAIENDQNENPTEHALFSNYPNPFNSSTTIQYQLERYSHVDIAIFDIHGRKITTLKNDIQPAGQYSVKWDGKNESKISVSSGQYFVRFNVDGFQQTKKILFLK